MENWLRRDAQTAHIARVDKKVRETVEQSLGDIPFAPHQRAALLDTEAETPREAAR